jgi:hypothetical protein
VVGPGRTGPRFPAVLAGPGDGVPRHHDAGSKRQQKDPGAAWFPRGEGLRDMLVVLGVTILFVALLNVLGMVIGTAIYLAVLIGYLGKHRWWVTVSVALAAAFFNWLVFVHWLHVPFPEGKFWIF